MSSIVILPPPFHWPLRYSLRLPLSLCVHRLGMFRGLCVCVCVCMLVLETVNYWFTTSRHVWQDDIKKALDQFWSLNTSQFYYYYYYFFLDLLIVLKNEDSWNKKNVHFVVSGFCFSLVINCVFMGIWFEFWSKLKNESFLLGNAVIISFYYITWLEKRTK